MDPAVLTRLVSPDMQDWQLTQLFFGGGRDAPLEDDAVIRLRTPGSTGALQCISPAIPPQYANSQPIVVRQGCGWSGPGIDDSTSPLGSMQTQDWLIRHDDGGRFWIMQYSPSDPQRTQLVSWSSGFPVAPNRTVLWPHVDVKSLDQLPRTGPDLVSLIPNIPGVAGRWFSLSEHNCGVYGSDIRGGPEVPMFLHALQVTRPSAGQLPSELSWRLPRNTTSIDLLPGGVLNVFGTCNQLRTEPEPPLAAYTNNNPSLGLRPDWQQAFVFSFEVVRFSKSFLQAYSSAVQQQPLPPAIPPAVVTAAGRPWLEPRAATKRGPELRAVALGLLIIAAFVALFVLCRQRKTAPTRLWVARDCVPRDL